MRRPAGDEFAIGWLLEWRATGALPPGRQRARICSAHEHGPRFVFTTIADGNVWRPSSAVHVENVCACVTRQRTRLFRHGVRDGAAHLPGSPRAFTSPVTNAA
ncbi:hypothetical protein WI27_06205 [Burkholderia cepacia]|nr:hypothetical protein WI27_06205 [Burkholderia cepacia]